MSYITLLPVPTRSFATVWLGIHVLAEDFDGPCLCSATANLVHACRRTTLLPHGNDHLDGRYHVPGKLCRDLEVRAQSAVGHLSLYDLGLYLCACFDCNNPHAAGCGLRI